ncbi:branched-chain amino acid ABC transporter permease [Candidatus Woesearchaeota archaeon]|nr:MAG: branched-chain amino acid ABC transporter permease [Candidatus Woesearchaeota archaeon]
MSIIPQLLLNGIIAGGIYALVALGYSLVFGVLRFINFAHGELFMIGAYIGWVFNIVFGVNILIAILMSIIITIGVSFLIERFVYQKLYTKGLMPPIIASFGVSIFLQALILMIFGAQIKTYRTGEIQPGISLPGGMIITKIQIVIIAVSIVLMIALFLYLKYTKTGKAMRAVSNNYQVALIMGINNKTIISYIFAIGAGLAAIGGVLVGIEQNLTPTMGVMIGIKALVATVVGGLGNIRGAVMGGFTIGIIENIGIAWLPSGYKDAIAFGILILMLIFRPTGLLGRKTEEEIRI